MEDMDPSVDKACLDASQELIALFSLTWQHESWVHDMRACQAEVIAARDASLYRSEYILTVNQATASLVFEKGSDCLDPGTHAKLRDLCTPTRPATVYDNAGIQTATKAFVAAICDGAGVCTAAWKNSLEIVGDFIGHIDKSTDLENAMVLGAYLQVLKMAAKLCGLKHDMIPEPQSSTWQGIVRPVLQAQMQLSEVMATAQDTIQKYTDTSYAEQCVVVVACAAETRDAANAVQQTPKERLTL